MITDEEREEIIVAASERILLSLPEVIGNLMTQHVVLNKINSKFYTDHPEFKDHKQAVASVLEKVESDSPGMKYEDLLEKAIPFIKERIDIEKTIDITSVPRTEPRRDFSHIDFKKTEMKGNGEI